MGGGGIRGQKITVLTPKSPARGVVWGFLGNGWLCVSGFHILDSGLARSPSSHENP